MITSIAMVKASGEMVHPAIIPTSKHCYVVLNSVVEKLICKSPKYRLSLNLLLTLVL